MKEALAVIGSSDALEAEEFSTTVMGAPYSSRVYHIDELVPISDSPTHGQPPPKTLASSKDAVALSESLGEQVLP